MIAAKPKLVLNEHVQLEIEDEGDWKIVKDCAGLGYASLPLH